jgi:LPXTG-motif cell wall-anchored protein
MSGGAIAATVIGSILGFALIVAALLFFWRRRRNRRAAAQAPAQGFVPHTGDERAVGKADTSTIFSRIREKIKKEKEELDYGKPPVETEQLPAYKARNSGIQEEVVDRV